jgi:hypothetical protein
MFRMAVGHSDDVDVEVALVTVFQACDAALAGATPKAGFLLANWEADHGAIVRAVNGRYPGIELVGSSTTGEMTSELGFAEDSIALALFASDAVDITAGMGRALAVDARAAGREAVRDARSRTNLPPALCVIFPTIGVADPYEVLDGLREELGPGVPILGGGASPRDPVADPAATMGKQLVHDEVADGGVAILLFSGPLAFSYGVDTGWRGVGPRAVVNSIVDGRVHEIDGRPAIEFFDRYLGTAASGPPIANPLAVFDNPSTPDFYLRTATVLDRATGDVSTFGPIPEGVTVQLTVAATDQIVEGVRSSVSEALRTFPSGSAPDAALVYSCATRRFLLGTRTSREIDLMRELVGHSVPIAGFYCLGEFAPLETGEASRFHNATLVSVLLGSA